MGKVNQLMKHEGFLGGVDGPQGLRDAKNRAYERTKCAEEFAFRLLISKYMRARCYEAPEYEVPVKVLQHRFTRIARGWVPGAGARGVRLWLVFIPSKSK